MKKSDKNNTAKDNLKRYYEKQFEEEHRKRNGGSKNKTNNMDYNKKEKVKKEKSKSKKNPISKFFGKIIKFIIVLLVICIILLCAGTSINGGGIRGLVMTLLGLSNNDVENVKPITILLLGVSEDLDSKLTDTIMLCTYNPDNQKASILSIPRDTFIGNNKNSAKGKDKINSLYSRGIDKLLEKVSSLTTLDVDNYIVINNDALIEIVDVIGGVYFDVPIDMDYDDPTQDLHIHLKAGLQKIDGEESEQLLRFRHNNDGTSYPASYGDNDFGRMRTQREFIQETIKQIINIKNVFKIPAIVNTVKNNIETNMELKELLVYVPSAINFSTENIISNQLPGESKKLNNLWFYESSKKETKALIEKITKELEL